MDKKKFIILKVLCKKKKQKDHKILLTKAANLACKFRVTSP